jgi:hypothetical protein
MKSLDALVGEFAENVAKQTEAIDRGDAKESNRCADRYIRAWNQLRSRGDTGRKALCRLFDHERPDVRTSAAAFLLRFRTREATRVLTEVAKGKGLAAFEASQALQRWKEGDWHLDPD